MDKVLVFDIQGWIIRILGRLQALITLLCAARELMRLQLVRALRGMGVWGCRRARVWFRLDALAAARAGNALLLATVLLCFDLQGWIALLAGALLALITLFTG